MKHKKFRLNKKLAAVILLIAIPSLAAIAYGTYSYIGWTNREVYNVNETISFNDFSVTLRDYSLMGESGMTRDEVMVDGLARSKDDCSRYPKITPTDSSRLFFMDDTSPEERSCKRSNAKIDIYSEYEPRYNKLALNLELSTKRDVSLKVDDVKTYINVPSGRDITKGIEFPDVFEIYTPYAVSGKDGYLHSELTRTINLWADLENDEKLIDVVIIYQGVQRIYRIDLN